MNARKKMPKRGSPGSMQPMALKCPIMILLM